MSRQWWPAFDWTGAKQPFITIRANRSRVNRTAALTVVLAVLLVLAVFAAILIVTFCSFLGYSSFEPLACTGSEVCGRRCSRSG